MVITLEGPEELEQMAFRRINEGKLKEGLKLILRAAKGYEEEGRNEDAARLYRYLGYVLLEKTGKVEKARPSLLKSAYLYIDLIEREISKPEVNLDVLDDYCLSVLEIFSTLGDRKNLVKYAEEFAQIYKDIGKSYEDNGEISDAIRAYESAYWYYRIIGDEESYKRLAEVLITLYGQLAETYLEEGDVAEAAQAFYSLAKFTWVIFGYDIHFIEMMDTAAKNYERASKIAYSEGDLDGTTSYLVKAQYAYLLARNFNRSKLIGLNTARMLNQLVGSYRSTGDSKKLAEKLMELTESLIAMGKFKEAFGTYKNLLEVESNIRYRVKVRLAVIKYLVAENNLSELFRDVCSIEYQLLKGRYSRAIEIAESTLAGIEKAREITQMIRTTEGLY